MKKSKVLSKRLLAVVKMVSIGKRAADIGTDHGYIPMYLAEHKIKESIIAADINDGPLEIAKKNIENLGFSNQIEVRKSNGLKAIHKEEVESFVIAGMGGALIIKILEDGKEKITEHTELILQPQSELEKVREFLERNALQILDEDMVYEEGKFYFVMKVKKGEKVLTEQQRKFGPILLERKHQVLWEFLETEKKRIENVLLEIGKKEDEEIRKRVAVLEAELQEIEAVLEGKWR